MYQITSSWFQGRTTHGRRPPTRKLDLERMEERTLLSDVHALFDVVDVSVLTKSPFPSDRFTVADNNQNTGLLVNLPLPDPATHLSDYQDTVVLNELDGFNLQPRLSIPFDGLINPKSVNSQDVFLVSLGDTLPHGDKGGEVVGINQVVWDPATTTLYVESDQLLDQHTRYALIVTNGVRDATGNSVQASEAFTRFRHDLNFGQTKDPALKEYRKDLLDGMAAAAQSGAPVSDIVTASVFTTMSATAVLEKIRDQIHAATPAPAVFTLGEGDSREVFPLSQVTGIAFDRQTTVSGPLDHTTLNVSLLGTIPGPVGQVAFGKYSSPDYEVHDVHSPVYGLQPRESIPPVATRTGEPVVQRSNDVYFNLFLPSGPEPDGGWPVAIFGHGVSENKNTGPLSVATTMAAHGIATITINASGSGYGAGGTLTVTEKDGTSVTFPAGGRSIDQNGDAMIGSTEGQSAMELRSDGKLRPSILLSRDGLRQTVADLMQLVREIQVGMDVNDDGIRDLDPSRISYFGQSLGGIYGTDFLAVEPDVHAGVPVVPGGSYVELGRLSPIFRTVAGQLLAQREPNSLVNSPGVTAIDGVPVASGPYFDENMPLRDNNSMTVRLADGTSRDIRSPVINTVSGATAIQEVFENAEWVTQSGNAVAYAPHLRKDPLRGVPAKAVLFQFAKGDQSIPNPTNTAIIRAGDLADRTTYYRNDLAYKENSKVSTNPHGFMIAIGSSVPLVREIAKGAQEQIATFFSTFFDTGEGVIIHPTPERFFETPIVLPLPEGLNFIIPTSALAAAEAQVSGSLDSGAIPTGVATDTPNAVPLEGSLSTTSVPASSPLSRTVMPASALVDLVLEALPPLSWIDSGLDVNDLAAGLLPHARRRR
jgi:hypothetical protein